MLGMSHPYWPSEEMALLFRGESVGVRLWSTFMGQEANEYRLHCSQPLFQAVEALDRPLEVITIFIIVIVIIMCLFII